MTRTSLHLLRPLLHASCAFAFATLPATLYAKSPPIVGHWSFQTATGTSTTNGVEVELIDKGILDITEDQGGLTATIAWLDERGQLTPPRKVQGTPGPNGSLFRHSGKRISTGRNGKETSTDVTIRWTLQANGDLLSGERLVESDEYEPKPVRGIRLRQPYMPVVLPVVAASDAERGPSTPAERTRV